MRQVRRRMLVISLVMTAIVVRASAEDPFPAASPDETGISAEAVELLGQHVGKLVEQEAVVGAELHLIKNRQTVLRQAYGWADREDHLPLAVDSVFCVRSMTKPLVGTAVQMLIDEGKLSLDQRVADILSEFDRPLLRNITIEHLLTHTSGLPFTAIGRPVAEYQTLRDVAADAAEAGLDFEPGASFQYSDAGSDTLGAIVAAVSGDSAEEFIASRVLQPVGMEDSLLLLASDKDLASRVPSAYSGGPQSWQRHWKSSDPPILPLLLTSQGLFCTTSDYARFLALWIDGGVHDGQTLLSEDAVGRALAPGRRLDGYATGFENCTPTYGQQWMVYHGHDSQHPVIFGHNGSDGTYAWAWPERDLIVLFFTQSRGSTAGVELEPVIDQLLIRGDVDGYRSDMLAQEVAEKSFKRYEGIYWDQDVETAYYAVQIEQDKLVFERPGRFRTTVNPQAEEGKFSAVGGSIQLEFEGPTGPAAAMLMTTRIRTERQVRHKQDGRLPTIDDLIASVSQAHGIDQLKDAGVIKFSGTMTMGLFRREAKIRQWVDSRRSRTEIELGGATTTVITNGSEAYVSEAGGPFRQMDGLARQQETLAHPSIQFGGWHDHYEQLDVLKQVEQEGGQRLLIRARAAGMPGATIIVDAETGLVLGGQSLQFIAGAGFVGHESTYSDFREVAGVTLPFHVESKFANVMLGTVVVQLDSHEIGVSAAGLFELPEN